MALISNSDLTDTKFINVDKGTVSVTASTYTTITVDVPSTYSSYNLVAVTGFFCNDQRVFPFGVYVQKGYKYAVIQLKNTASSAISVPISVQMCISKRFTLV